MAVIADDWASETPTESSFPPLGIARIIRAVRLIEACKLRSLTDQRPLSGSTTQVEKARIPCISQCALQDNRAVRSECGPSVTEMPGGQSLGTSSVASAEGLGGRLSLSLGTRD